ncbi:MAG: hypothetical protein ACYTFU_06755 [Planctomycetota bacterium]
MRLPLFIMSIISVTALASISSSSASFVIAFSGEKTTAIVLEKDADYVSVSVEIQSKQKDPIAQIKEIKQVKTVMIDKAKNLKNIEINKGPISLSASPEKFSLAVSSGYYRGQSSTTQLNIMTPLDEKSDIYDCAIRIRQFLDSVNLPSKAELTLGKIQLTVKSPEQYRAEILKKIGDDVEFVKSSIEHNGEVEISGLQQPVLVRQVDDRRVELFINYSMTIKVPESR